MEITTKELTKMITELIDSCERGSMSKKTRSEMIDELLRIYAKNVVKSSLGDFSQQREQLIAFFLHFRNDGEQNLGMTIEEFVDDYLSKT